MSSLKFNKLGFLAAGVVVLALGMAQGCSSDDDSQAQPTAGTGNTGAIGDAGSGNSTSNGGKSGGTNSNGGGGNRTSNDNGGEGGTNPGGDTAGAAGEAGSAGTGAGPSCDGPNGCYSCTPSTSIQFANHCVTGGCPATFDNSKLSKLDKVGTL